MPSGHQGIYTSLTDVTPVHCKSVSAQEVHAILNARKAVQQGFIALEMSMPGVDAVVAL